MKNVKLVLISIIAVFMSIPPVFAQDPIIYPNQGQSPEQQEKDKFECYNWAKTNSGFDPMISTVGHGNCLSEAL